MECERKVLLYIESADKIARTVCHYLRSVKEPNDKITFLSIVDNEKITSRLYNLLMDKSEKKVKRRRDMLDCAEKQMRSLVGEKLCYVELEKEVILSNGASAVDNLFRYSREKEVEVIVCGSQQFNVNSFVWDDEPVHEKLEPMHKNVEPKAQGSLPRVC